MLDAYKTLVANQFEAAFCTVNLCIDRCPDEVWDQPVVNNRFCQAIFHTLFFTDFYLESDEESFQQQPFHLANPDLFRDYEELADRPAISRYEKAEVKKYLEYCRQKAAQVIAGESADLLNGPSGFARRKCTRAELHVYNIRHIYHHAAQLSMRLRIATGEGVPWVDSGWREERSK